MNLYVIVPLYNEAKMLPALLEQLRLMHLREITGFGVVFCDNNSTDGSGDLIREFSNLHGLGWHVVLETQKGTGAAADTAARAAIDLGATHLLRTDADCLPPVTWAQAYRRVFASGAYDLVTGKIVARTDENTPPLRRTLMNVTYDLTRLGARFYYRRSEDPSKPYLGPHRMVAGGNMAVTADMYQRAGGFPRGSIENTHEDLQLLLAVRRLTTRYGFIPDIVVPMSARRIQAWGIINTVRWYTEHSWRPADGKADIR